MKAEYTVRLIDRGELIEYRDDVDVYHFDARPWPKNGKRIVYLPGSKGKYYEPHELTEYEQEVILPRVRKYLEGIKNFVWFGRSYPVSFERRVPMSPELNAFRHEISRYLASRDKSD